MHMCSNSDIILAFQWHVPMYVQWHVQAHDHCSEVLVKGLPLPQHVVTKQCPMHFGGILQLSFAFVISGVQ